MSPSVKVSIRLEQRARILTWFDYVDLVASRRPAVDLLGTVELVHEVAGNVTLSVRVDGVDGIFRFKPSDLETYGLSPSPGSPVTWVSRSGDPPSATPRQSGMAGFLREAAERKPEPRR